MYALYAAFLLFSTYTAPGTLTPYATYDGADVIPNLETEYPIGGNDAANMVQRWWIVDAASYDGSYSSFANRPSNISFNFKFNNAEIHSQSLGSLSIQPFVENGSETKWDPAIAFTQSSSSAGTPNQVISPSISAANFFRTWVLVNSPTLLPIELRSFNAVCNGDKVNLNWSTVSETNNDYFTIEHSKDLQSWEIISTIPGAGNSNTTLNYSITDNKPYSGTNYYRLKQTDFNGNYKLFNVISAGCNNDDIPTFSVYPNPVKGQLNVKTSTGNCTYEIKIINEVGKVCYNNSFSGSASLDLSGLRPALYYVIITDEINGKQYEQKIVVI